MEEKEKLSARELMIKSDRLIKVSMIISIVSVMISTTALILRLIL